MTDGARPLTASSPSYYSRSFPQVPTAEFGFALSIFVAAASRRLNPLRREEDAARCDEASERDCLYADLLIHGKAADPARLLPHQSSLSHAFNVLWSHCSDHPMRDAICARVLCFHFLMERTEGRVIERWMEACPDRPEQVFLDRVVVEALARTPLHADTGLVESDLLEAIAAAEPGRSLLN